MSPYASQEPSDTPRDVPEVLDRLGALQKEADARAPRFAEDGLACFNYLYTRITEDVLAYVERSSAADPERSFEDPEFLRILDVQFAKRYLDAVRCDEQQLSTTPRSWQVLFESRGNRWIKPMQFAVAGVNAHVNYDLAFAVVSTCQIMGRPVGQGSQRSDYQKINDIFAAHMRELRRHFEDKLERVVDHAISDLADDTGDLTVVLARDAAWRRAEYLWALRDDPEETELERRAIDWRASMAGRGILALPLI